MMQRVVRGAAVASLLALQAESALAAEAADEWERYGRRGQIVISSDAHLSFGHVAFSNDADAAYTRIVVAPAADVFVTDGLSLGLQLEAATMFGHYGSQRTYGFGPRVGYALSMSERWSLHPSVGVAYEAHFGVAPLETMAASLFAPIQFHPAEHFFVGFGPHLSHELEKWEETHDLPRSTIAELRSVIGGYF